MMDSKFNYYQFYTALSNWLSRYPRLITVLRWTNRAVVVTMYVAYLLILAGVCWRLRAVPLVGLRTVAPLVVIPGLGFFLVSFFRHRLNAPRPYEVLDITPLIHKDTRGNSFPSRHVFSVFVIDMAFWWVCPLLGGVFLVIGVLIALIRVIGGVHFPRDVLVGAVMGAACGAVDFWLIP